MSRDEAAAGVDVARHTAKFHLDRLVDDGLLEAEYRRPAGRRGGPGAGRPAKLYRRADVDVDVSLPPRRYDLAARLLVRAVAEAERTDSPVAATLRRAAHDAGRDVGASVATDAGVETVATALEVYGFEPKIGGDGITLSNCPFHVLAEEETQLVCGMNLAFLEGVLEGAGASHLTAVLDPAPGRCCVKVHPG